MLLHEDRHGHRNRLRRELRLMSVNPYLEVPCEPIRCGQVQGRSWWESVAELGVIFRT